MGPTREIDSSEAHLWRSYRFAFEEFSKRARAVYNLRTQADADPVALETASVELDKARVQYNKCRDLLASRLLPSDHDVAYDATLDCQTFAGSSR